MFSRKQTGTLSAVLFLSMLLSACGGSASGNDTTQSTGDTTTAPAETTTAIDLLTDANYNGAEFNILAGAQQWATKYDAEETGEMLDDAVYKRNRDVEERYNIKITYDIRNGYSAGKAEIAELLRGSVMAGDMSYDLFVGNSAYVNARILDGVFVNLNDQEALSLDEPWYFGNVNQNLEINDKLYVAAGAFGINTLASNNGVFFNKELLDELKLENPYDLVRSGKWTLDKMLEMGASAYADLNGNTEADRADRFGFVDANGCSYYMLAFGAGYQATETGEDGLPKFTGASEKIVDLFTKLAAARDDSKLFYTGVTDTAVDLIPMFVGGQALFTVYNISIMEFDEMREAPDFGIVPLPKFDESQENYLTQCFADVAAIPKVVKDMDMSGVVLESLNCYSYTNVIPVYKEVILQNKLTRDDDTSEMIDLIIQGTFLDFGTVFFDQLSSELLYVQKHLDNHTSWWAEQETALNTKLENIIKTMTELED